MAITERDYPAIRKLAQDVVKEQTSEINELARKVVREEIRHVAWVGGLFAGLLAAIIGVIIWLLQPKPPEISYDLLAKTVVSTKDFKDFQDSVKKDAERLVRTESLTLNFFSYEQILTGKLQKEVQTIEAEIVLVNYPALKAIETRARGLLLKVVLYDYSPDNVVNSIVCSDESGQFAEGKGFNNWAYNGLLRGRGGPGFSEWVGGVIFCPIHEIGGSRKVKLAAMHGDGKARAGEAKFFVAVVGWYGGR